MPRALISVSDKSGIVELSAELAQLGFEIVSTGGTAKTLREAKIPTMEVSELTGYREILEGRVKTLHPKIFGGILFSREKAHHKAEMESQEILPIDWVVVNLYPFEKIMLENKFPREEMLEFIDIGGVSLLRAAAKNYTDVVVLSDQKDYQKVVQEFKENGRVAREIREILAQKAFAHTAHYDSMIARFFQESDSKLQGQNTATAREIFPQELTVGLRKVADLRYGENPQQKAALYKESGERNWGIVDAKKLQGKDLSFNNYLDLDSAWQIVHTLSVHDSGTHPLKIGYKNCCCAIVKHTNPCGVAVAESGPDAYQLALASDAASAFGGIVGFSSTVEEETANLITKNFFECVIAPDYSSPALEIFRRKPNLRVVQQSTTLTLPYEFDIKKISGGMLVQERDIHSEAIGTGKVVTKRKPTAEEFYALEFAWKISRFVKSNAIVLARGTVTEGIGAGQMSRIDSLKIAVQKARSKEQIPLNPPLRPTLIKGEKGGFASVLPLVLASDGFFPFRDCVDEAAIYGVSAIIQPSGSIRDQESIDAANEHNIAMVFTGIRHFWH